jgi:biopolymer transport protein ExbB/TolQ
MPSSRRVFPALPALLFTATPALAQDAAARSPWLTLIDNSPAFWAGALMAALLVVALIGQLVLVLRQSRGAPSKLVESLGAAIHAGNYQEAWEICHHRGETVLGRMLQPALERIGQGRDSVETRLAEEGRRERRHLARLLRASLCAAAVALLLCAGGILHEMRNIAGAALTPGAPRAATLALGNAAMFAAFALAIAAPVIAAWGWLRARAESLMDDAGECSLQLIAGLPYEDIEGLRIGRDFHAGTLLGDGNLDQTGRLQVSRELTTQCPTCNGPINSTRDSCPHCGQLLSWSS